jgi:hypothetical protein
MKKKNVAILSVESINFSMKTEKEKETISYAFQKFLNSIDFPIQILMTTETLNLDNYLSALEGRISKSHQKEIFNSYKEHMKSLVEEKGAMNRNFYVIIPEVSDIEIQVELVKERLHGLNLKTSRLENQLPNRSKLRGMTKFI